MFKSWSCDPSHDSYVGVQEIAAKLPAGLYQIATDMRGNPVAKRQQLKNDELFDFAAGPMRPIVDEVNGFWDAAAHYKKLGVTHKRGILLHGPAGAGKTGIVARLLADAVAAGGLAFQVSDVDEFRSAIPLLRQIENGRRFIVSIEDLDKVCEYAEEDLLETLDGATSLGDGMLFVATTNYLNKIPVRLRCRPSRIDTLIEVPLPDEDLRLEYLRLICKGAFARDPKELKLWAQKTRGFSMAALKELVLSVAVYQRRVTDTIDRLKHLSAQEDAPK